MKESVHLRTFEKGNYPVISLFNNEDELIIALPHRVSITLHREGTKIEMDCDLGIISSSVDFCRMGQIDISQPDYQSAVSLNRDFMERARSFENHFHVEKYIRERARYLSCGRGLSPQKVFSSGPGSGRQDQVWIHLAQPTWENIANIEFSVYRADFMDDEPLTEPFFTLCSSVQLRGQVSHYWLFVDWCGDDMLLYEKNFFYNNTVFFDQILEKQKLEV